MKTDKIVITAFCTCVFLSLALGALLFVNVRAVSECRRMIDAGKQIQESVLEMQLEGTNYLLFRQEDVLENVRDRIGNLRKLLSSFESEDPGGPSSIFSEFAQWDDTVNIYERLFDQFVLAHRAVEKNISEIRNLEKSILAVIFSKMNPERGIIALQEIRIHEKGFLLYRNYPEPPDAVSFEDKRREAVSNLLMWARKDKRIEDLMEKDNWLFNEIKTNYESQDNNLAALNRESAKMRAIADAFLERGNDRLRSVRYRSGFLSAMLLIMWSVTGAVILYTRFR